MTNTKLPDFEGLDVRKATVRITKAGDGLSEALSFEPVALHHGAEVFFVLRGLVSQVNHRPDGKVDEDEDLPDLVRVHTVDAIEVVLVDEHEVGALLERNRTRLDELRRARGAEEQHQRDAEAGLMRIPGTETAEYLEAAHGDGAHSDGLVDGCPCCDAERDAEEAGD